MSRHDHDHAASPYTTLYHPCLPQVSEQMSGWFPFSARIMLHDLGPTCTKRPPTAALLLERCRRVHIALPVIGDNCCINLWCAIIGTLRGEGCWYCIIRYGAWHCSRIAFNALHRTQTGITAVQAAMLPIRSRRSGRRRAA